MIGTNNNSLFWIEFDKVSSALRVSKALEFYPDIDLEEYL